MSLSETQRDQGMRGLAAARRAGRLADSSAPLEVRLPGLEPEDHEGLTTEIIALDLLRQARHILGLTNRQIAGRTDLTVDLIAEIDAGRFAVTLEELIIALADLGLAVTLESAPAGSPTEPSPEPEPPGAARLPYRDD